MTAVGKTTILIRGGALLGIDKKKYKRLRPGVHPWHCGLKKRSCCHLWKTLNHNQGRAKKSRPERKLHNRPGQKKRGLKGNKIEKMEALMLQKTFG